MQNPFTLPNDQEKINLAREWIKLKIKQGNFTFHDFLDKIREYAYNGDKTAVQILCYFAANVVLNSRQQEYSKNETITELKYILENVN